MPKAVKNEDNGDIACDSYHKYEEDVQLLKDIGVSIRFYSLLHNSELTWPSWDILGIHCELDYKYTQQLWYSFYFNNKTMAWFIEKGMIL